MKASPLLLALLAVAGSAIPGGLGCGESARPSAQGKVSEVSLPPPSLSGKVSVEEALARRRSVRQFRPQDLALAQVGQLAWAAQGITEPRRGLRTAPSAGALYPLELYLMTREGLFHYLPAGHKLARLSDQDLRAALSRAALGQPWVGEAPLDFVIAAVYERTRAKYADRAERYVLLEAGHAAQNVHLQAVALGLGSVPIGAFDDKAVASVLDLPASETPLYIIPVGYPVGSG